MRALSGTDGALATRSRRRHADRCARLPGSCRWRYRHLQWERPAGSCLHRTHQPGPEHFNAVLAQRSAVAAACGRQEARSMRAPANHRDARAGKQTASARWVRPRSPGSTPVAEQFPGGRWRQVVSARQIHRLMASKVARQAEPIGRIQEKAALAAQRGSIQFRRRWPGKKAVRAILNGSPKLFCKLWPELSGTCDDMKFLAKNV